MLENSIANVPQTQDLYRWVLDHLADPRENNVLLGELNSLLQKHQLPLIDLSSPELGVHVLKQRTMVETDPIGASISDGKFRFCFPCEVGWNIYKFGIIPTKKSNP